MKKLVSLFDKAKSAVSNKAVLLVGTAQLALLSGSSYAQEEFNMPTVNVPGAEEGGDPLAIFFAIFKWIGLAVVWILIMLAGIALMKNILKSINKVRRDEEAKWPEVIGDILGNAVVVVVMIAFGTWLTTFLA